MNMKKISPQFFVCEQIKVSDVELAATHGIKTIICNRPHNETDDQPETHEIATAAAAAGIEFLHIPVVSGSITDENIAQFAAAHGAAEGPVLAYCRSGMRSTCLWALTSAESLDIEEILSTAQDAGYDLAGMRPRLESLCG